MSDLFLFFATKNANTTVLQYNLKFLIIYSIVNVSFLLNCLFYLTEAKTRKGISLLLKTSPQPFDQLQAIRAVSAPLEVSPSKLLYEILLFILFVLSFGSKVQRT